MRKSKPELTPAQMEEARYHLHTLGHKPKPWGSGYSGLWDCERCGSLLLSPNGIIHAGEEWCKPHASWGDKLE